MTKDETGTEGEVILGGARPAQPGPALSVLHVLTLYMLAFVQPLFGVLAESPTFFAAHRAGAAEVLTIAGVLCFGLPLPGLAVVFLARRFMPPVGRALVLGCLALLASLIVLRAIGRVGDLHWIVLVLAATAAGAVVAFGYWRFGALRSFLTACSVAVVVVPGFFLGFSPVSGLLVSAWRPPVVVEVDSRVPVVYVLFDELPLTALLDPDLSIDEVRFPNLASLAHRSTWYPHATTVAVTTQNAVPAMLTGRRPRTEDGWDVVPRVEDLPENLFTLLAGSFDLHVFESMTALCPKTNRGCRVDEGFSKRLRRVGGDLAVLQAHVLLPAALTIDLPDVTTRWRDFSGSEPPPEAKAPARTQIEVAVEFAADRWRDYSKAGRAHHYQLFLQSLQRSSRTLFFLHSLLPHQPFEHLPSGQRYRSMGAVAGLDSRGVSWLSEEAAIQAQQRHLLQLAYVDRLVGDLLARLESTGLYDDALLVVGADHGASFRGGGGIRELDDENWAEVLSVPLFIKYPGQREGRVDDRNAETIDILPTIAAVLGIDMPWKTDGHSLLGPPDPERPKKRVLIFVRDTAAFETVTFALGREALRESAALQTERFGSGLPPRALFGVGPFRALLGTPIDDWRAEPATQFVTTLERAEALQNVEPTNLLPLVQGRIEPPPQERYIAVCVNGIIRNVTRPRPDGAFTTPLPAEAFTAGANVVEIALISGSPESPVLHRTRTKP
jgi:hypothetical protein